MANLEISKGERLDQRVVSLLPTLSRSFAAQLINQGKVTLNGAVVTKPGTKIKSYDDVVLDYDLERFVIPEIDLGVIYEDDDSVVIDKPAGLLTHSKGSFNPEPSVATWLHNRIVDKNLADSDKTSLNNRAGIVHRLDRATSGVMICAKTLAAQVFLQKQFASRKAKKTYLAVVCGIPEPTEAVIDLPIGRNPKKPATFRVDPNGKPSSTRYRVTQSNDRFSLLELKPTTGRTHQLRVHLKHLGYPIVGDTLYGGIKHDRLMLHASELEITVPNGDRRAFSSQIPTEFKEVMEYDETVN